MLKVLTWLAVVPYSGTRASFSDIGYISVESRHIFASSDDNFHRPLRSMVSPNATYFVVPYPQHPRNGGRVSRDTTEDIEAHLRGDGASILPLTLRRPRAGTGLVTSVHA
jgi:hypothetical protein